ncbi:hypothetical protein MTO96_013273 [Rhipicephalus appendiculatus]
MGRLVSDASVALRRNGPQPSANRTTESSGVFMLVSYPASTDPAAVAHASASCSAERAAPAEVADSAPLVTLAPASTRGTANHTSVPVDFAVGQTAAATCVQLHLYLCLVSQQRLHGSSLHSSHPCAAPRFD